MALKPTVKKRLSVREIECALAWTREAQKLLVIHGRLHDVYMCLEHVARSLIDKPTTKE